MRDDLEENLIQAYQESTEPSDAVGDIKRLRMTRELLLANPPPTEPGGFLLVVERNKQPFWHRLEDETTIGRGRGADLVLAHPWISKCHCRVSFDGDDWRIDDLQSRNGLRVNGESESSHILSEGDAIQLGSFLIIFIAGSGFEPGPTKLS